MGSLGLSFFFLYSFQVFNRIIWYGITWAQDEVQMYDKYGPSGVFTRLSVS